MTSHDVKHGKGDQGKRTIGMEVRKRKVLNENNYFLNLSSN